MLYYMKMKNTLGRISIYVANPQLLHQQPAFIPAITQVLCCKKIRLACIDQTQIMSMTLRAFALNRDSRWPSHNRVGSYLDTHPETAALTVAG